MIVFELQIAYIIGATLLNDLLSGKRKHVTTAYISGASPMNAGYQSSSQDLLYNYSTLPQVFD